MLEPKKTFALLTSLGLLCALGAKANAQQSCEATAFCRGSGPGADCVPHLPATAFNCFGADFDEYCQAHDNHCSPAPECPTCDGNSAAQAGSPIDLGNGNTSITQTDLRIPGLGGGLTLARTWNSVWPSTESAWRQGLFGPNWRSTYEERVFVGNDGYMKYSRGDGSFWSFGFSGYDATAINPEFTSVSPANQSATLIQGTPNWTLTFKNGETRIFDHTSGYLTSIIDRNGNTTQLSYDTASRLISVADPASHHLYFSYFSPSTYLVTGVSSDFGISLSYSYDGQGRLLTVTKPDSTTVTFQYDSSSFISAVLDSNGKVLEQHTYDIAGKGLTSSRAGGVEGITVSYPQPPQFKGSN